MQTFKERNYKKEYENYHSKPEQKKRRAGRNKARRDVVKSVKDSKQLVGKDVHHKDNNPLNNDKSNLSIVTQKYNRTEPRKRNEEREPQDKDIKDKKGTQPAKYLKVSRKILNLKEMHTLNLMMVKVHIKMHLAIRKQGRRICQNLNTQKIIKRCMMKL